MLDEKLLAILACPKCKGDLEYTGDELRCHACKLAYPVEDDMPIMVIEKARPLEEKPQE
jgi:uncharacterized protein YbaR (Trm112 family)